ncbi:Ubiquitin-like modifier-activating enzyme ATG7 [Nymphon striatum]|nr:Ubiquitin-like modifier-activating enzyme ATG7 [Nymphon striatum]
MRCQANYVLINSGPFLCIRGEMEMQLQFAPFASAVDHGFWFNLNKKKLDVFKLNTNAVEIFGYYKNDTLTDLPPCLNVDYTAFEKNVNVLPNAIHMQGNLLNYNTSEDLKNSDKKEMIDDLGKKIWNDIKSGTTLKDPTLLNRFLIISYADLKKFHYYYWFAFPAITFSNYTFTYKSLKKMSEVFTTSQILEIQKQYDGLSQKSHFLVEILNDVLMLHSLERLNDLKTFQGKIMVGFSDPSSLISNPGWPLRNFLAQISYLSGFDGKDLEILCFRDQYKEGTRHSENSIVITVHMPKISLETESTISFVGWERNERHKFGPRLVNLSKTMDPVRISESAVDLNLKLIRWRIIPELDLNLIKDTKCLLLGSGTLGCNIARCLLGWGVRNITFVDNSTVSYSNPVRQSLFKFEDSLSGETSKSIAAAESLKLIFPGVNSVGVNLSVPMPGHSISSSVLTQTKEDVEKLENLIDIHDVVFLLMDTRESRWLPTLIASSKQKITINAALGFDSYLVMRHGVKLEETSTIPEDNSSILGSNLGCYFCNDVVAPADSTRDRTLDQACTVSRPGVSMIAAALATELLMSLLQHPDRGNAPANLSNDYIDEEKFCSVLGIIPHQIRGFLSQFSQVLPATSAFDKCTACSSIVRERYEKEGFEFLLQAFNDSEFLENVSGLTALKNDTLTAEVTELSMGIRRLTGLKQEYQKAVPYSSD